MYAIKTLQCSPFRFGSWFVRTPRKPSAKYMAKYHYCSNRWRENRLQNRPPPSKPKRRIPIHTIIHTYGINTYTHTYIHTCMHTYIHTFIHTYIHTFIHSYIHTYIHTNASAQYTYSMLQYLLTHSF